MALLSSKSGKKSVEICIQSIPFDIGGTLLSMDLIPLSIFDAGDEHRPEDRKDLTSDLLAAPSR